MATLSTLSTIDGGMHVDLRCAPTAGVSADALSAINTWERTFVPTAEQPHHLALPGFTSILTSLAGVATSHESPDRRGAALLMFQLLPRLVLRPTHGKETGPSLVRLFQAGKWGRLVRDYHAACVRHARDTPDRHGATDASVVVPTPMHTVHDGGRVPDHTDRPRDPAFERALRLVSKGRYSQAREVLLTTGSTPYSRETFAMLKSMQFAPCAADPSSDLATLRDVAREMSVVAVANNTCLDATPLGGSGHDDDSDVCLIVDGLRTARVGSSPAPSGQRLEYVRAAAQDASYFALAPLAVLVAYIANGGLQYIY